MKNVSRRLARGPNATTGLKPSNPEESPDTDPLQGQFGVIRDLLYGTAGIRLVDSKHQLVHARISRRLRQLGMDSVQKYVSLVQSPQGRDELTHMVDALTTNKTSFFREEPHFKYLEQVLATNDGATSPTFWSAGCSSGEEPYTLAMVMAEHHRRTRRPAGRILATDISERVLEKAMSGEYPEEQTTSVPPELKRRYLRVDKSRGLVKVGTELRRMIRFARLNLMADWPMSGPFQGIFCRNVMIYFDTPTRQRLVQRFASLLAPGGYLFVGHSESLTSLSHDLEYVQPAVYRRGTA